MLHGSNRQKKNNVQILVQINNIVTKYQKKAEETLFQLTFQNIILIKLIHKHMLELDMVLL